MRRRDDNGYSEAVPKLSLLTVGLLHCHPRVCGDPDNLAKTANLDPCLRRDDNDGAAQQHSCVTQGWQPDGNYYNDFFEGILIMLSLLLHRVFTGLVTIFVIMLATFLLLHTIPGGPFDSERKLPPEIERNLYEKYGLHPRGNDTWIAWVAKDLGAYLNFIRQGQAGPSLKFKDRDVAPIIAEAMVPTLILGTITILFSVVGSFILALKMALQPNGITQRILSVVTPLALSLPRFSLAALLVLLFSSFLKWLPPALWEGPSFAIIPLLCLIPAPLLYLTELLHTQLQQESSRDYVKTARAKGLTATAVLIKHTLKNALSPFITALGPITAQLMTGSFIVESLFSIPGLGRHFVHAVIDRDYFLVMGVTLLYGTILVTLNLITDFLQLLIDPRLHRAQD